MRLTAFTDYAIRALLYTAAHHDRLVTIAEIQTQFNLSKGHLMKIVHLLAGKGYFEAIRGRAGGIRLGMPPHEINIGALVRVTEPDFRLVECFGENNQCRISACCRLPGPLNKALSAFLKELDQHTLADMMIDQIDQFDTHRPATDTFPQRGPNLPMSV